MAKIITGKGVYRYTPKPLFVGRKRIDKNIAKQNLLDFNEIAKKNQLHFGLIYGTLLGAVREHDFIEHDEDIDLFVLSENRDLLLNMLFELKENGFDVARFDRRGLVSIIRDNEYIDLYIFRKYEKGVRICCGVCILEQFLEDTSTIEFLSGSFTVPKDYLAFLAFEYGSDWKVPIPYTNFDIKKGFGFQILIKEYVKNILPDFIFYIYIKSNERKYIKSFYDQLKLNKIKL